MRIMSTAMLTGRLWGAKLAKNLTTGTGSHEREANNAILGN